MNRVIYFLFFSFLVFAKPIEWNFDRDFSLKKDEIISAKVATSGGNKDFMMRWTLFKKDGVVVLVKYDDFPYQFILYPDYQRNRFNLRLEAGNEESRLMIVFHGFDKENKKAKFWLGVEGQADLVLNKGRE